MDWIHTAFDKKFVCNFIICFIWISKNFLGFCSSVNVILGWYGFTQQKVYLFRYVFLYH